MNKTRKNINFRNVLFSLILLISAFQCQSWGLADLINGVPPLIDETPVNNLSLAGIVSTFAGTPPVLNEPNGIVSDGTNLYIADTSSNTIKKVVIATGQVSVIAGKEYVRGSADGPGLTSALFDSPKGVALVAQTLYVTDTYNCTVRQIDLTTSNVVTFTGAAGNCTITNGNLSVARFSNPYGIYYESGTATLYVTDGSSIRSISLTALSVSTIALPSNPSNATGIVYIPSCCGNAGAFYIADRGDCTIKKMTIGVTNTLTTFAGKSGICGYVNGYNTSAQFQSPTGITTDNTNLYVTDSGNHAIRQVALNTGTVSTVAGTGLVGSSDGSGTSASFNYPLGITNVGPILYVTDSNNQLIRQVDGATPTVSTLTGIIPVILSPLGITTDGTFLYVVEQKNHVIRKVEISTGIISTLAGGFGVPGSRDGVGTAANFFDPFGITIEGGYLYVTDSGSQTIRKIDIATAQVSTFAGTPMVAGSADGAGTAASFNQPSGITSDGTNLYVADSRNNVIRKIDIATANVSTFAGTSSVLGSYLDGVGAAASFNQPYGITNDGTYLYIADTNNHAIRKINIADANVTTIAGTAGIPGGSDGTGLAATFNGPVDVVSDGTFLYVSEMDNHTIRAIDFNSGVVTTLAGMFGVPGYADGTGSAALFGTPAYMVFVGTSLYVTDYTNNQIRKID